VTGENFVLPRRLDWRNLNTLWGSLLAETLSRLGCRLAVVSPGSRSAPLTYALAQHPDIEAIPVLDERSAAFFALGLASKPGSPSPWCVLLAALALTFSQLSSRRQKVAGRFWF
jgi:2-succinyl-5-enolpyruvyl-6-hydroxy-3-cyclohexene-1-carboxylate synthase